MTNEEILKKAIEKAEKNGYKAQPIKYGGVWKFLLLHPASIIFSRFFAKAFWGEAYERPECDCLEDIGQFHRGGCISMVCPHCGYDINYQPPKKAKCNHVHYPENCEICYQKSLNWADHLRIMVLEKDPIKYLEKFL